MAWNVSAGEWLQALATVLGVGATLLGTLYVEKRMQQAGERDDRTRIIEIVAHLAEAAAAIRAGLPDDPANAKHAGRSLRLQQALKKSLDMYRDVRNDTKAKKLGLLQAL